MSPCFFIFGFGYTARALSHHLISQGFSVVGTSSAHDIQGQPSQTLKLIDFNSPDVADYIKMATHLLVCVPPTDTSTDVVLAQYGDLIKKQAPSLQWCGYLSSTGVYGDHQGSWVDEESPCLPHTSTGIARLKVNKLGLSLLKKISCLTYF